MRFYADIIADIDPEGLQGVRDYTYHIWNAESIARFWSTHANNPFLKSQFYPLDYWRDLIRWAKVCIPATGTLKLVDVGCGSGNVIHCWLEAHSDIKVLGIDLSESSLEPARQRFKDYSMVSFKVGSFNALPLESNSVDLITATEVLEHLPSLDDFHAAFAEATRVLKPGGFFLATTPSNEKCVFVVDPDSNVLFTPYQHMIFEISQDDIRQECQQSGLAVHAFYSAVDRSKARNWLLDIVKNRILIPQFPFLAQRFWPMPGATGFIAQKM